MHLLTTRSTNMYYDLGMISRKVKLAATDTGIRFFVYSQLNRNLEARDDKRPTLPDLRDSGNLEEDADIIIGLYRDEMYNKMTKDKGIMEVIVLKQRNGPIGMVRNKIILETNKIIEV